MSERDESTSTETQDEMRPLPDGGLSDAMPDWLRRPPAWRDLPRPDEPAKHKKTLPQPDLSVIDPRQLVTIDDLPQWLRDIAARESQPRPDVSVLTGTKTDADIADVSPELVSTTVPNPPPTAETTEATATTESTVRPATIQPWIWAMRAAIILIILSIIYYVFLL